MLKIGPEDLAYAKGQLGLVKKLVFGDQAWEACLLLQEARVADGRSLGQHILDRLVAIKERELDSGVHRTVRTMLTWVFAPVFRSSNFALPTLEQADFDAMDRAYTSGTPEASATDLIEDVRSSMSRFNDRWGATLIDSLLKHQHEIPAQDRQFILICARLLAVKMGAQKVASSETAPEQEAKAPDKESNVERVTKLLNRQLAPIHNTGVVFSDVGGCREPKRRMTELSWILAQPEAVSRWGAQTPRGVLLYGPPGTGKTLLTRALATHAHRVMYLIKMSDIFTLWYGQSLEYLSRIFAQAKAAKGAILFFDEADGVISNRSDRGTHEESGRVVTQFNIEMGTIKSEDRLIVVLATNSKDRLDEAAVRDERINMFIPFALPDQGERNEILSVHRAAACNRAGRSIFHENVDLATLAAMSDGLSGAALADVIERALWVKALHDIRDGVSEDVVTQADMVRSLRERLSERACSERRRIGFRVSPPVSEDLTLLDGGENPLAGLLS